MEEYEIAILYTNFLTISSLLCFGDRKYPLAWFIQVVVEQKSSMCLTGRREISRCTGIKFSAGSIVLAYLGQFLAAEFIHGHAHNPLHDLIAICQTRRVNSRHYAFPVSRHGPCACQDAFLTPVPERFSSARPQRYDC